MSENFTYVVKVLTNGSADRFSHIICSDYTIEGSVFSIEIVSDEYSTENIVRNDAHCIIIDLKREQYSLDDIVLHNNQIEIYIPREHYTGNEFNNVFPYTRRKLSSQSLLTRFIKRRFRLPLFNGIVKLSDEKGHRFYTPGHIEGKGLMSSGSGNIIYQRYGPDIFTDDISISDDRLGSLLMHSSAFKQCELMIANAYNAKHAFISVHGSSTANKVIITSLLNKGDKVIVDRNIHKSIMHSIIIAGGMPRFINANFDSSFNILLPGKKTDIMRMLDENRDAKMLIFTSPTYEGVLYDLTEIISKAHTLGMKVLVDQAWGSHLHFNSNYHPGALMCGADYVVHSFHKTLTAFSMSSAILVNDPDFETIRNDFIENYLVFASTSPFYPIAASMDVSRRQMSIEGKGILNRIKCIYDSLVSEICSIEGFNVMDIKHLNKYYSDTEHISIDYTRLTVSYNNSNVSKKQLVTLFRENNVTVEKINDFSFTIILTPGIDTDDANHFIDVLKSVRRLKRRISKKVYSFNFDNMDIRMMPQDAFFNEGEWIPVGESIGRISSILVVPYPPGIPLIIPGQLLDKHTVDNLLNVLNIKEMEMHGIMNNSIKVVKNGCKEE